MGEITIDAGDRCYILTGAITLISQNARAKSNFTSIGALFDDENQIIIPFDEATKEDRFKDIDRLLNKFGIGRKQTSEMQTLVERVLSENQAFSQLSQNAYNIRNGKCKTSEFENFIDVVAKTMKRKLYRLQLLSAYHLAFAQNTCNFSVPGSGKTSIVYAAYSFLKQASVDRQVGRLVIICPLAAFGPWKSEYIACFGKEPKVKEMVNLSPHQREIHFATSDDTEITLISYQSAAIDIEHIKNYLEHHKDIMLVLDEAHRIKNTRDDAVWANAIKSVAQYAKSRVILTGTPVANGYEDLYNLFEFIWPGRNIIGFPLNYLKNMKNNPRHKDQLVKNIEPFFIRIRKNDLNLPEPIYNAPIMVPMAPDQKVIYDYIEKNILHRLKRLRGEGLLNKFQKAKTIHLQQCLTNPALLKKYLQEFKETGVISVDDWKISEAIESYRSTPNKFIELVKLIKGIIKFDGPPGKVIVWAYFIENIKSLEIFLQKQGIKSETLYGATPNETEDTPEDIQTREKIIREFHDDTCPYKVILANPFAVGESISLHKACHNAIYLEKGFNAANYMQSKDRVHRYGLNSNDRVNYYFLLSEDSIDLSIHRRVLDKEKRMLEIIEKNEIPLLQLGMSDEEADEDDIRVIIEDYYDRKSTSGV